MNDIRWKQRFQNFENAWRNFEYVLSELDKNQDSKIHKMALIQAYEMVFELGWKTLKDYLYLQGTKADFPRAVIKEAFAGEIIEDGKAWIKMLEDRNLIAHTYDETKANMMVEDIRENYYPALVQVYKYLGEHL